MGWGIITLEMSHITNKTIKKRPRVYNTHNKRQKIHRSVVQCFTKVGNSNTTAHINREKIPNTFDIFPVD